VADSVNALAAGASLGAAAAGAAIRAGGATPASSSAAAGNHTAVNTRIIRKINPLRTFIFLSSSGGRN
jgi:hypothetical protein